MQTKWNLQSWYKGADDPRLKRDVSATIAAYHSFAKKWKAKTAKLGNPATLKTALDDYAKLTHQTAGQKPLRYFYFRNDLNATDAEATANLQKLQQEVTKAANEIIFFELAIAKIPKPVQQKLLKAKQLQGYRYYLERVFKEGTHHKSEAEERIMSLLSQPGSAMWIEGLERAIAALSITVNGGEKPLPEIFGVLPELPTKDRHALHTEAMHKLGSLSKFSEAELNAVLTNKKIRDEIRGYKNPWSATVESYENDEKSVLSLVEGIASRYDIAHRFYKVKAKLLKQKELTYADRSAKIGTINQSFSFEDSANFAIEEFTKLDPEYGEIFDRMVLNGQLDVYPTKSKTGGAYCASGHNTPTMVLLNHTNNFRSLSTLAHEMGHAVHAEMSKNQPPLYEGHTISTAETASTLFEGLVMDAVLNTLPEKDKIIALHDILNDAVATVFRQIAFFRYEQELHKAIREKGYVPHDEMAAMLNRHTQDYMGKAVKLTKEDGNFYIYVSHFRRPFYVYSYAYGFLLSSTMREMLSKDPKFAASIKEFLTAGGSESPETIFKSIGINTAKKDVFLKGLERLDRMVTELEKLTK